MLSLGRAMQDGLAVPTRSYLLELDRVASGNGGGVRVDPSGFHSKIYCGEAVAVIGSSNLTEHGMSDWTEANVLLSGADAKGAIAEAQRLFDGGLPFSDVVDNIPVAKAMRSGRKGGDAVLELPAEPGQMTSGISISLLDRKGEVPPQSGLNWGLAGGRVRDRFECYIRFPKSVHDVARYVFGSVNKRTQVVAKTHDGRSFTLVLEGNSSAGEDAAKQISTLGDKSILGKWMIVDCMGIRNGGPVTARDLAQYGRQSVDFFRIGTTETGLAIVYLDFSRRRV